MSDAGKALWNPNAAANWSLLFSPAFGAWLHAANWQAVGEPERAAASMRWFYLSLAALAAALLDLIPAAGALAFLNLIAWYFISARAQARYVKDTLGSEYPRRGWARPIVIALAAGVAVTVLVVVLASLTGFPAYLMEP